MIELQFGHQLMQFWHQFSSVQYHYLFCLPKIQCSTTAILLTCPDSHRARALTLPPGLQVLPNDLSHAISRSLHSSALLSLSPLPLSLRPHRTPTLPLLSAPPPSRTTPQPASPLAFPYLLSNAPYTPLPTRRHAPTLTTVLLRQRKAPPAQGRRPVRAAEGQH